jgi:sugar phosphate permease
MPIVMSVPVYFLLLTFPENSKALSERERHIAINRFGRGATRKTDVTWSWPVFFNVITRPSTIVFFIAYVCVLIVATSLGTFLPVIFNTFLDFSSTKSNIYTSAIYLVAIPEYAIWSWHSDHTRERMWHYLIPIMLAIPCFGVWTHVASNESYGSIKPITLYGLAFLGKAISICQPAALAYRSATLYGATEQAVGGAVAVASLSIASIIGPQIFPHHDRPWYLPGFSASLSTLCATIILYSSLPFWFLFEARRRKAKYGHAMPLRALEDAGNAQVSEAARMQEQEQQMREQKGRGGDVESADHFEEVREEPKNRAARS